MCWSRCRDHGIMGWLSKWFKLDICAYSIYSSWLWLMSPFSVYLFRTMLLFYYYLLSVAVRWLLTKSTSSPYHTSMTPSGLLHWLVNYATTYPFWPMDVYFHSLILITLDYQRPHPSLTLNLCTTCHRRRRLCDEGLGIAAVIWPTLSRFTTCARVGVLHRNLDRGRWLSAGERGATGSECWESAE
ncbi:hypothetical protein BJ165DRAFT_1516952 [Panaeolus papilionaceus]|nr:hypothetical protein BJ165DRAFT_1516952 [Panaeolus papilionaceus]